MMFWIHLLALLVGTLVVVKIFNNVRRWNRMERYERAEIALTGLLGLSLQALVSIYLLFLVTPVLWWLVWAVGLLQIAGITHIYASRLWRRPERLVFIIGGVVELVALTTLL